MFKYLIAVIFFSNFEQTKVRSYIKQQKNQSISCQEFIGLVKGATKIIKKRQWNTFTNCILIAKIDNTLSVNNKWKDDSNITEYKRVSNLYSREILDNQIKTLNAVVGMGL